MGRQDEARLLLEHCREGHKILQQGERRVYLSAENHAVMMGNRKERRRNDKNWDERGSRGGKGRRKGKDKNGNETTNGITEKRITKNRRKEERDRFI